MDPPSIHLLRREATRRNMGKPNQTNKRKQAPSRPTPPTCGRRTRTCSTSRSVRNEGAIHVVDACISTSIKHGNRRRPPATSSAPLSTYVVHGPSNRLADPRVPLDLTSACNVTNTHTHAQVGLTNYINGLWQQAAECFERCDAMMAPVGGACVPYIIVTRPITPLDTNITHTHAHNTNRRRALPHAAPVHDAARPPVPARLGRVPTAHQQVGGMR